MSVGEPGFDRLAGGLGTSRIGLSVGLARRSRRVEQSPRRRRQLAADVRDEEWGRLSLDERQKAVCRTPHGRYDGVSLVRWIAELMVEPSHEMPSELALAVGKASLFERCGAPGGQGVPGHADRAIRDAQRHA